MAQDQELEKFPDLVDSAIRASATASSSLKHAARPGVRRKSSGLPSDIRAGDTSGPAFSTLSRSDIPSPPTLSPRASGDKVPRVSKRSNIRRLFRRWKKLSWTHTWFNPLLLTLLILAGYAISPGESNPIYPFIFLSYPLPADHVHIPAHAIKDAARSGIPLPTYFGKGLDDLKFVSFYIIVLSFTREFAMQRLLRPIARSYGFKKGKQSRFMEQAYTAMYFAIFGPYGLYVMSRTPLWYFQTTPMFEDYPHKAHEGVFKAYYLLQAAYWAQQAIVLMLQLEKPRKDFKELVAHHVVTLGLIALSYRFHFTYMGLAVYITHDISDFFLATSKCFNYIESPIVVPYFAFFIGVWVYMRHYINLRILWATLTTFKTIGPFEINWVTEQYKCRLSQNITFGLLATLQSINLFWLYLILKIALRVITDDVKEDVREAGESDEDEEETVPEKEVKVLAASGADSVPSVQLNGKPVNGVARSTIVEEPTVTTPRREGLRKR